MSSAPEPLSRALTRDEPKSRTFASDTYYQESAEQLADLTGDPVDFAQRHGLLLLKPDAVVARQLLSSVDWLGRNGFRVVAAHRTRLRPTTLRSLWYFQWNLATRYRRRLADLFMDSVDSLLLVVRDERPAGTPASLRLTDLKGPTNPGSRKPGELRYEIGRFSFLLNLAHTTDEPADVLRELGVLLTFEQRARVFTEALTGADRADQARELAAELYREIPARELDFAPAAQRLREQAAELTGAPELDEAARAELLAALHAEGEQGLRLVLETYWRHGLALDPWDVVIVGTSVFPMKLGGHPPLLDSITGANWAGAGDTEAAPDAVTARSPETDRLSRSGGTRR